MVKPKKHIYSSDIFQIIGVVIVIGVIALIIFVQIVTLFNPNFFVRDTDEEKRNRILASLNEPKDPLPSTLKLGEYHLQQIGFRDDFETPCNGDDDPLCEYYDRTVTGKLTNTGDTIKAWSLHVHFNVYDTDGDRVDDAYCIIWNDEDIKTGETWNFSAFDNLDDCFPTLPSKTKLNMKNYIVVYHQYDDQYGISK